MRTRVVLAAVAAAALLPLAACSGEAGPEPKRSPDPGPGALYDKIDLLMNDPCFREPTGLAPPECEKYVTQLASVPGNAAKYAGGDHPELKDAGSALGEAIAAYRDNGCAKAAAAPACSQALRDVADALREVEAEIATLPGVTANPR
ncbi:hypothetical protein B0I33_112146 [Prauserella shujinwangii]|uniref:Secreted protein n=1 Tax=Prauserella shujinwangii TaxID=1453103 RepID=A0A2T0LMG1_9PSEU|nr:hypothetical protein [Prauserella shujinwangii]PRX44268.1 hypothetical protein B0I33_112146 [Prauserella shujinwangii]